MSNFNETWGLFGKVFCQAMVETGKVIAEGTHAGFKYMSDVTDVNGKEAKNDQLDQKRNQVVQDSTASQKK